MTSKQRLLAVLSGETPDRVPFAPNIWQWFEYRLLHGTLPAELGGCRTHLEAMEILGVDIFARNLLTDIRRYWFGGHAATVWNEVSVGETIDSGYRRVTYQTPRGPLSEVFHFQEEGGTLIQIEYLFKDFDTEFPAWKALLEDRRFRFDWESYRNLEQRVGERGLVIAGEITCPLKQLHILARSDQTTFLLADHEPEMVELMSIYEDQALQLVDEMVSGGVRVVMSMDNLDSLFYPPPYFDRYCSEFYRRAAGICHRHGAWFFSHACGKQRNILSRVVECGIDGLEGIAFPPLGDIDLWQARSFGDRFIVDGGLSAVQLEGQVTRETAEAYTEKLFDRLRPFHRFIYSMSCNTPIDTSWDTLRHFRDAWLKHGKS